MPTARIKIYGERNTGTNYLTRLVGLNLDAECLIGTVPRWWRRTFGRSEPSKDRYFRLTYRRNLGWKHMLARPPEAIRRTPAFSDRLVVLTLAKNPYSWLLSLHRRPYHAVRRIEDLEEFLQAPWPTVGRENHAKPFTNPIDLWNRKNTSYRKLHEGPDAMAGLQLRYEDLVLRPGPVLEEVAERFSMPRIASSFRNLEESTKKEGGRKDFTWYQAYYGGERWREELTPRAVELVNAHLDAELVKDLGYAVLAPDELA